MSALVKAMRAFPADAHDDPAERWARISSAVPGGRLPAECKRKAAELATALKTKRATEKGAAAAVAAETGNPASG